MDVEFYTSSGFSHKTKTNDPIFSPLLECYVDTDTPIPPRVELMGSVGEIVEKQWPIYCRLKSRQRNYFFNKDTIWIGAVVELSWRKIDSDLRREGKIIALSEVLELSRILNLNEEVLSHACIDRDIPRPIRIAHLQLQAKCMPKGQSILITGELKGSIVSSANALPVAALQWIANNEFNAEQGGLMMPNMSWTAEQRKEQYNRRTAGTGVIEAFFTQARMNAERCGRHHVTWDDVLWEDLATVLTPALGGFYKGTNRLIEYLTGDHTVNAPLKYNPKVSYDELTIVEKMYSDSLDYYSLCKNRHSLATPFFIPLIDVMRARKLSYSISDYVYHHLLNRLHNYAELTGQKKNGKLPKEGVRGFLTILNDDPLVKKSFVIMLLDVLNEMLTNDDEVLAEVADVLEELTD